MRIAVVAGLALICLAAPARAAIIPGATVDGPSAQIPGRQAVSVDVAPDGTAAIAYLKDGDVYVSQLVNGAWSSPEDVDNLPGAASRPDVAVANGGKIVVAFLSDAAGSLRAAIKPAGGSFPGGAAPEIETALAASHVDVDLAPNGDGYATYTVQAAMNQDVRAAYLSGTTWTPVGAPIGDANGILDSIAGNTAGDSMHEPRVAVNGAGSSGVVAWAEDNGTNTFQVFARRLTGSDKGPAPVRADLDSFGGADGTGKNADQLDVASDAAGNAWVVFRDNFTYPGPTDKGRAIVRRFVGNAFEPPQLADALGDPPPESIEFPKLDVNATGQGLLGAYRQMAFSTQAAALDGPTWTPLGDINVTANPGVALSVPAIAGSGNGLVAWVGADGLVRARVRGNGSLGAELVLSQAAAGASNGSELQAAADQQSFAVVAFPQGPANNGQIVAAVVDLPAPPVTTAPDTVAPVISAVRLSRRTFAVGAAPTPVAARLRKGTTITYSLSEPATVGFRIERALPGRRSGGRCRKPTRRLRTKRTCTRFKRAGTLRRSGAAGANRLAFSGRIGRRALKPARYRLTLTATDTANNPAKAKRSKFRIVRSPKRRLRR